MNPYWSYLLTAVGVLGLYLAGRKQKTGWLIGLAAQVLWLSYGLTTHQGGFVLSALIYGAVYSKNFLAWRREARQPDQRNEQPS